MITGIFLLTAGMAILVISISNLIFVAGIVIFLNGESTAHPKFICYSGLIALEKKKAPYPGYAFPHNISGSFIGGIPGTKMCVYFVDQNNNTQFLWMLLRFIGFIMIFGLLIY